MTKKWHHVRILESTFNRIKANQKEYESDGETIDRIIKFFDDLPSEVIHW